MSLPPLRPPESLLVAESAVEWPTVRALLARVPPGRTLIVAESAWAELAQLPAAIGLLAVVAAPVPGIERAADFCLLLDNVQDPGNVGSMLRSAAAAGVAQVFMSPHCAFAWSPKVLRAGQGAHFHLAIFEGIDLGGWARAYRGKVVAMVAAEGTSLYEADLSGPVAIAIGNEGAGSRTISSPPRDCASRFRCREDSICSTPRPPRRSHCTNASGSDRAASDSPGGGTRLDRRQEHCAENVASSWHPALFAAVMPASMPKFVALISEIVAVVDSPSRALVCRRGNPKELAPLLECA
jgi:tRNA(Leu) C34 or U34 (ribose-2'-O)-methylase TrmL